MTTVTVVQYLYDGIIYGLPIVAPDGPAQLLALHFLGQGGIKVGSDERGFVLAWFRAKFASLFRSQILPPERRSQAVRQSQLPSSQAVREGRREVIEQEGSRGRRTDWEGGGRGMAK